MNDAGPSPLPPRLPARAFCITLRTSPRWSATQAHLRQENIYTEPFHAIDAKVSGLETRFTYELDHPGSGYHLHSAGVCLVLSHYLLWRVLAQLPDEEFLVLEDDARFLPKWRDTFAPARAALPADWDMLFIGSCNCADKPKEAVGPHLYRVRYPFCTHAYLVRRKALAVLDGALEKIWAPIDIALNFHAFPKLNVYTVLPRIVEQFETYLDP